MEAKKELKSTTRGKDSNRFRKNINVSRKKIFVWILVFALISLSIWIDLLWLGLGLGGLGVLGMLFRSVTSLRRSQWILSFSLLMGVTILSVLIRVFIVEIYSIPSSSMENALFPGDKILVSKLNYGPKLPQSPLDIPWFNLFFLKSASPNLDSSEWDYRRLAGFSEVKHNDIVVFKGIDDLNGFMVKRCIGLPGERITIRFSEVFVDDEKIIMPDTQKKRSRVWIKDIERFLRFADSSGIVYGVAGDNLVKEINLTESKKKEISNLALVDSIRHVAIQDEASFGHQLGWDPDNLGPLLIPSKGSSIKLNRRNFTLYHQVINRFEKAQLSYSEGRFYLGGRSAETYTFKYNYYFMIGDNWSYSNDSRFWGVLAETNVIGKTLFKF